MRVPSFSRVMSISISTGMWKYSGHPSLSKPDNSYLHKGVNGRKEEGGREGGGGGGRKRRKKRKKRKKKEETFDEEFILGTVKYVMSNSFFAKICLMRTSITSR